MANEIQKFIDQVVEGQDLSEADAGHAFQIIMNGGATPAQMSAFLVGLKVKGECASEITGAAKAMRSKMIRFSAPSDAIDTCGTGGDGKNTLNVSTAVAIVLAACGLKVVKHGNRAISSSSGSSDVLKALGVNVEAAPEVMQSCLQKTGFAFLLAPKYHPAMRHVAPVRQELRIRTIFNLVGPLCNPAEPAFQLLGVYDPRWMQPLAETLRSLGNKRAWVVHGNDGVDELSISGPSQVITLENGELAATTVSPETAGLESASLGEITGKDAEYNAKALERLLTGEKNAYRNAVLLNASAGLLIAGKAADLKDGVRIAAEAIDGRKAKETLAAIVWNTNEGAHA